MTEMQKKNPYILRKLRLFKILLGKKAISVRSKVIACFAKKKLPTLNILSVIAIDRYIFGANQNRNHLNLSETKYYSLVSAKINRTNQHHGQTV